MGINFGYIRVSTVNEQNLDRQLEAIMDLSQ